MKLDFYEALSKKKILQAGGHNICRSHCIVLDFQASIWSWIVLW